MAADKNPSPAPTAQRRVYDDLAKEGGGTWATYMMIDIEKAFAPSPATNVLGVDIPRLPPGTPVQKIGGYPFQGTVVAAFETLDGNERFVVEATHEAYRGMLHIFNGSQLRVTAEGKANG